MEKMNSFDNKTYFNNDNLEEKTRLSHFSPVLLKKKGTKLVFLYKGQKYDVDSESDESREDCKETLNNLDSEHTFDWFKEETGNKQWVLYDTKYFYIECIDTFCHLHYKEDSNVGDTLTIPLNCSSCYKMFENYRGKSLTLFQFDTTGVITMQCMFAHSHDLVKLDLSGFNTESVKDMQCMFRCCSKLFLLDMNSFRTENLISTDYMFSGCVSLEFLDLTSFKTTSLKSLDCMFYDCSNLQRIYVSQKWKLSEGAKGIDVFGWCSALPKYNVEQVDVEMASPINQDGNTILYKILSSKRKAKGYLFLLEQ